MDEVLKFLQENGTFYLATVEGDQPRVRPFGVVLAINGKLSIITNTKKAVYKQLIDNPKIELAATAPDGTFLRVSGKAEKISSYENKRLFLDTFPTLQPYYSGEGFNNLEVFAISEVSAEFQTLDARRRKVEL